MLRYFPISQPLYTISMDALAYDGPALELLTGTSPSRYTCCSSAQTVRLAGGSFGRPRTDEEAMMFGAASMRIHPTFTRLKDWTGDGKADGIEAVVELQDAFGETRRRVEEVLAVVQEEHCPFRAAEVEDAAFQRRSGAWLHGSGSGDDLHGRPVVGRRRPHARPGGAGRAAKGRAPRVAAYSGHGAESISPEVLKRYAPPPVLSELSRRVQALLDVRAPGNGFVSSDGKAMFFTWAVTGTPHVWRLDGPQRFPVQMTGGEDATQACESWIEDGERELLRLAPVDPSVLQGDPSALELASELRVNREVVADREQLVVQRANTRGFAVHGWLPEGQAQHWAERQGDRG